MIRQSSIIVIIIIFEGFYILMNNNINIKVLKLREWRDILVLEIVIYRIEEKRRVYL